MDRRLMFQEILEGLLEDLGIDPEKRVYFQPPETVKLIYPCIIYKLSDVAEKYADNTHYFGKRRYDVLVIDRDPDSAIPKQITTLPYSSFDRCYTASNLHHFAFQVFY